MKQFLIVVSLISLFFASCKKESKDCWQVFDPGGADVTGLIVCDATKAEAEEKYPRYWEYRAGEAKYCWKATKPGDPAYPQYLWGIPASMKGGLENNWGYTLSKVDCNSFCNLRWYEKHKSKITGFFGPVKLKVETLINSDSCSRLSIGVILVYRETSDSIIIRELFDKKP